MKNPHPVNLKTPEQVRKEGWMAEARDDDGHLISTHAPFDDNDDIQWFVRNAMSVGNTVTIWPHTIPEEQTHEN